MRKTAGSAAAPAATCKNARRGSFMFEPPSRVTSLDHLVRASEQRRRHIEAERLGGGQIDDEVELGWLLDRNVGRLRAAQNLVNEVAGTTEQVWYVCSIGHQTSRFDPFPNGMHGRQSRGQR